MADIQPRQGSGTSLVEILDHVLDKGIVIDAWVAISVIGIELVTIEARVIVASVETYVKYSQVLGEIGPIAGGLRQPSQRRTLGEGLKDLQGGLGSLPLPGKKGQQQEVSRSQASTTSRGKSKSKKTAGSRSKKK